MDYDWQGIGSSEQENRQRLYSLYRLGGHLSASMVGIAMVTRQIFETQRKLMAET